MHVTPDNYILFGNSARFDINMLFGNGVRLDINMPLDIGVARCHQHSYRQNERRKQRK